MFMYSGWTVNFYVHYVIIRKRFYADIFCFCHCDRYGLYIMSKNSYTYTKVSQTHKQNSKVGFVNLITLGRLTLARCRPLSEEKQTFLWLSLNFGGLFRWRRRWQGRWWWWWAGMGNPLKGKCDGGSKVTQEEEVKGALEVVEVKHEDPTTTQFFRVTIVL